MCNSYKLNDHALIATPKSGGAAENFRLVRPPYQRCQNPAPSCSIPQNPGKTVVLQVLPVLPTTALLQIIQGNIAIKNQILRTDFEGFFVTDSHVLAASLTLEMKPWGNFWCNLCDVGQNLPLLVGILE